MQEAGSLFDGPLPDIGLACRDPNDDHVIATAVAVKAGIIVTGDKDLLALGQFRSVRIPCSACWCRANGAMTVNAVSGDTAF